MSLRDICYDDRLMSSDSDDEFHENLFSSSSQDRSSVGSIPWAEDAIKQNQLEWERLERMFYGEEKLPSDPELRNEIIEWKTAFPHLRISGRQYQPKDVQTLIPKKEMLEEIIAIDPPKIVSKRKIPPAKILKVIDKNYSVTNSDVSKMFANDLRISSVPMLSKRRQISDTITKDAMQQRLQNGQRNARAFCSHSTNTMFGNVTHPNFQSSISAKTFRMPPITNYTLYRNKDISDKINNSYVAPKKQCDHVVLPTLNLNGAEYFGENVGRSISAAYNQKRIKSSFLPNSASKLKSLK